MLSIGTLVVNVIEGSKDGFFFWTNSWFLLHLSNSLWLKYLWGLKNLSITGLKFCLCISWNYFEMNLKNFPSSFEKFYQYIDLVIIFVLWKLTIDIHLMRKYKKFFLSFEKFYQYLDSVIIFVLLKLTTDVHLMWKCSYKRRLCRCDNGLILFEINISEPFIRYGRSCLVHIITW